MSNSEINSASEAMIECCRNTKDGILECLDWFRISSLLVFEKVKAQFNEDDKDHIAEISSRNQPFIAGRVQSRRGSGIPTGSGSGRWEEGITKKIHFAHSSVATQSEAVSMPSQQKQNIMRPRANTSPSGHHDTLKSMLFRKHKQQELNMYKTKIQTTNDHHFVTGQSDAVLSNTSSPLKAIQSHEDSSAWNLRGRRSTLPFVHLGQSKSYEHSRKCKVSASFNYELKQSVRGSKLDAAKCVFNKLLLNQKSTDETSIHPKSEPDCLNRISDFSFLKEKSTMRRTKSVQNEEQVAHETSYSASTIMFGDVSVISVDPKKKRDPCKDAGYDPSTIVPPVSCFSYAAAEENKPHFHNLKAILRQIESNRSLEEVAFNKVKALCQKRHR
ncbi:hypothetical protein DPMN_028103 [Dreissena polymorpha]|uniref:Uncharacterized protein n=1 Tax=Dreissena polymorpha TaxID=45954 RepID=A0A9D4RG55_DREPO|nr:hypothetical protein DPMN_028103 [Dreissena polymorpha]